MANRELIQQRLQEDYKTVQDLGYEVFGVFLQGSQNYELDYEYSDIDTKAIILPSLEDIVLNKKPVSFTHLLPNNEHIDIKDIRSMFSCFKKQNINFIEILFTKYSIINCKYATWAAQLFENAEMLARYDIGKSLNCMCGMAMEKHKALTHPYPATMDKIEKFGYDPKQLHHIFRLSEFMYRYIGGELYAQCLISNNADRLIQIKKGELYTLEEAKENALTIVQLMKTVKTEYFVDHPNIIHVQTAEWLDHVLMEVVSHSLKTQLMSD